MVTFLIDCGNPLPRHLRIKPKVGLNVLQIRKREEGFEDRDMKINFVLFLFELVVKHYFLVKSHEIRLLWDRM